MKPTSERPSGIPVCGKSVVAQNAGPRFVESLLFDTMLVPSFCGKSFVQSNADLQFVVRLLCDKMLVPILW